MCICLSASAKNTIRLNFFGGYSAINAYIIDSFSDSKKISNFQKAYADFVEYDRVGYCFQNDDHGAEIIKRARNFVKTSKYHSNEEYVFANATHFGCSVELEKDLNSCFCGFEMGFSYAFGGEFLVRASSQNVLVANQLQSELMDINYEKAKFITQTAPKNRQAKFDDAIIEKYKIYSSAIKQKENEIVEKLNQKDDQKFEYSICGSSSSAFFGAYLGKQINSEVRLQLGLNFVAKFVGYKIVSANSDYIRYSSEIFGVEPNVKLAFSLSKSARGFVKFGAAFFHDQTVFATTIGVSFEVC